MGAYLACHHWGEEWSCVQAMLSSQGRGQHSRPHTWPHRPMVACLWTSQLPDAGHRRATLLLLETRDTSCCQAIMSSWP